MIEKKIKYLVKDTYSGGTPTSSVSAFYEDSGIPWVAIGDMSSTDYIIDTYKKITEAGRKNKNLRLLPKGTILYSIYATLGKVSELGIPSTINQAILALFEDKNVIDKNFFKYSLISLEDRVIKDAAASTVSNLSAQKVLNMKVPIADGKIEEQKRIANYLDIKCSKLNS